MRLNVQLIKTIVTLEFIRTVCAVVVLGIQFSVLLHFLGVW